jgi:hypothetical protein
MGSTLSFPILCIANLLCYHGALQEYTGKTFSAKDLPTLVNGDDILFRTNDEFYPIWMKWITSAGFVLSVGKNYVHPNFFTINSALFHHSKVKDTFTQIPFLNLGLLLGLEKGKISEDPQPIWDKQNKLFDFVSKDSVTYITSRFLIYNKEEINLITKSKLDSRPGLHNLYIERAYGGCGFLRQPQTVVKVTKKQRDLSYLLHTLYKLQNEPGENFNLPELSFLALTKDKDYDYRKKNSVSGVLDPELNIISRSVSSMGPHPHGILEFDFERPTLSKFDFSNTFNQVEDVKPMYKFFELDMANKVRNFINEKLSRKGLALILKDEHMLPLHKRFNKDWTLSSTMQTSVTPSTIILQDLSQTNPSSYLQQSAVLHPNLYHRITSSPRLNKALIQIQTYNPDPFRSGKILSEILEKKFDSTTHEKFFYSNLSSERQWLKTDPFVHRLRKTIPHKELISEIKNKGL